MPTYQTTGIIIGRTNFGEADRIVRFITPDHGKISAVAKGVRRLKSRLGGHLELFGEAGLTLATGRNLDVVASARLAWYPHELTTDYARLNLAYVIAKMTDRVATERQAQTELYEHLREALQSLNDSGAGPLLELWFKLRLLTITGFRPELQRCVACGRQGSDTRYFFSSDRGGIVCDADAHPSDRPLSHDVIKLWRLLCDYPYTTVAQVAGGQTLAEASLPVCEDFCEHHLGRAFHR